MHSHVVQGIDKVAVRKVTSGLHQGHACMLHHDPGANMGMRKLLEVLPFVTCVTMGSDAGEAVSPGTEDDMKWPKPALMLGPTVGSNAGTGVSPWTEDDMKGPIQSSPLGLALMSDASTDVPSWTKDDLKGPKRSLHTLGITIVRVSGSATGVTAWLQPGHGFHLRNNDVQSAARR
ncbi:hypothetical protein JB92DRAFT_2833129 [Gautieria morchelliformis]|nr:hypothetical protein JB92DRAFT_2833129 [Gautieria morchelliformis]